MFTVVRMMSAFYASMYRGLNSTAVVILTIVVAVLCIVYLVQDYLLYLMILLGVLAAARIGLWWWRRYW